MPGKACERYIYHVMEYAYFFEMPKTRALSVSLFFCSNSHHVLFFEMADFHMVDYFEMPNFRFILIQKWAFQNNRTYENRAFEMPHFKKKST